MTNSLYGKRKPRGIRDKIPQGYLLGRSSKGDGPVELIKADPAMFTPGGGVQGGSPNAITALTGHVVATGPGAAAATIQPAVVTEAMQVLADNTTQDVSTTKHGYAPKAPNDATKFLDGTGAYTVPTGSGVTFCSTTEQLTGTETTKASNPNTVAALWEQGADEASGSTVSLGEGGYFHLTGTTTITDIDFDTDKAGRSAILTFDGILTLTHNATTLILPTGANITTAAGDTCKVVSEGSDNVRVVWYQRKDGTALATSGSSGVTLIASSTPTGTGVVTFSSIAAIYRHLLIMVSGRSTAGATPGVDIRLTFNNDTGSNYDFYAVQSQGTGAGNPGQVNGAAGANLPAGIIPWSGATASNSGYGRAEIFNYRNTSLFKSCRLSRGTIGATTAGSTWITMDGIGHWRSTAAIDRVDLTLSAGNYDTGSQVDLYGYV